MFDLLRELREEELDEDILGFIRISLQALLAESSDEVADDAQRALRVGNVEQTRECEVEECPQIIRFFEEKVHESVFLGEDFSEETAHEFIGELVDLLRERRREVYLLPA